MKIKKIFFILCILMLAGCVHDYTPPLPCPGDPAHVKLAEAAVAISDSLETLEGIRKAENPDYEKCLPDFHAPGLTQLTSVDWTGPIGPLVEKIAIVAGYSFHELGNPPAIPVIVAINKRNIPLALILRDADYQAGTRADVVIFPCHRVIELRYRRFCHGSEFRHAPEAIEEGPAATCVK